MITRRAAIVAIPAAASGCAAFAVIANNPIFLAGLSVAIDVGVGLALRSAGANAASEASQIVAACNQLEASVTGSTVTLQTLESELEAKIAASITNPAVVLALDTIVEFASTYLNGIAATILPGATAELTTVLEDIATAAGAYVTVSSTLKNMKGGKATLRKVIS
jgi:Flp pilus assembly protein TadG